MMIFENFSAGYDRGFVIRGINCRLDGGKIYALIGPNAAGKTTMLRSIIRDVPLRSGGIIIDGNDTAYLTSSELAKKVSYAPSEMHPAFDYSVLEFVAMGRFAVNRAFWETEEDINRTHEAISAMGLEGVRHRSVAELSSGQKQSCLLAQIVAKDTDIILLDEPAAHLDIAHRTDFFGKVLEMKNNARKSFIITFHDLNDALNAADEFILLKEGEVAAVKKRDEINEETLSSLYGTELSICEFSGGRRAVLPLIGHIKNFPSSEKALLGDISKS